MPKKPTRMLRRGSKYYLHARIPMDLLWAYPEKKSPFITRSLRTSDLSLARKRLSAANMELELEFEGHRRKQKQSKDEKARRVQLATLPLSEREEIVLSWLSEQDAQLEKDFIQHEVLDEKQREDIEYNLTEELSNIGYQNERREYFDGSKTAEKVLEERNIGFKESRREFRHLAKLFTSPVSLSDCFKLSQTRTIRRFI